MRRKRGKSKRVRPEASPGQAKSFLVIYWQPGRVDIVGCHSRFARLSLPSLDVGVELKMGIRSLSFVCFRSTAESTSSVAGWIPACLFVPGPFLWPLASRGWISVVAMHGIDTFGFSLCMGSNDAGPGQEISWFPSSATVLTW